MTSRPADGPAATAAAAGEVAANDVAADEVAAHKVAAHKERLRRELLARRRARPAGARAADSSAVVAALEPLVRTARRVAAFAPLPDELDLRPLLALRPDVLLPMVRPDRDLDWATAGRRLGRQAVAGCDLVLVPALAVDRRGTRLGRGGGSYDRALARATGRSVAVVADDELLAALPRAGHDVPVAAVVTPRGGVQLLTAGPVAGRPSAAEKQERERQ